MLKAKLLLDNSDSQESIQLILRGKTLLSSSGNPRTISISKVLNLLESKGILKAIVADNIRLLIGIRDESVHFAHDDLDLNVRIQSVGTAALKNFMALAVQWFAYDFQKFNFYLMPVSFYHSSEVAGIAVGKKFRNNFVEYLNTVEKHHEGDEDPNFSISLKLETRFVKTSSEEALQVRVTDDPEAPSIQVSEEDALKNYPYTYKKLTDLLRKRYSNFKQNNKFNDQMREMKRKGEKFVKQRRLEPKNPNSLHKEFYHNRIVEEFDKLYSKNPS